MREVLFVTLLLAAFLPGSARAQEVQDSDGAAGMYPLEPGDAIGVLLSREPDLSGQYSVDEQSLVRLPLIGTRNVRDVPPRQLRQEILDAYGEQVRNQAVQVTLLRRVRVLGAVNEPGLYHVDPTMTVVDAVALAGGASSLGRLTDVEIFRDGERIESTLELSNLEQIRSGDQIVVPERSWLSRNTGVVIGATLSLVGILVASR